MNLILLLSLASIGTAAPSNEALVGFTGKCHFPDEHPYCGVWKDQKFCNDDMYGHMMNIKCAKTCKCDAPCQFPYEHPYCGYWKDKNFCNDDVYGMMKIKCAKTCKCGGGATGWCGKEYKPLERISGGKFTQPNQYPWMVRLPMGCGGSLITDRHILTAQHCLDHYEEDPGRTKWVGDLVKVSIHNQNDEDDYETIPIKEYVYPPMDRGFHDFAIITLEYPVDLSDDTIGTICLPASADEDYRGNLALALGWGMTHVGSAQSPKLKEVQLEVSQQEEQNFLYTVVKKDKNGVVQEPCAGDSGGPLMHQDDVTGRWTIIGTVYGGGYDCRIGRTRGEGVWNKITDHLEWIKSVIGN